MIINIILLFIIVLLIILLAYLQNLHYSEIKGLYSKLGITIESEKDNIPKSRVKNHIKNKLMKSEKSKGGE